jgi:fibulin 1/2
MVINFIIDINECIDENLNTCEQLCDNTAATHNCLCFDGYELNSDGFSCSGLA